MKKIYFRLSATTNDDVNKVGKMSIETQGTRAELCILLHVAADQDKNIEKVIKLVAENFDINQSIVDEAKDISHSLDE